MQIAVRQEEVHLRLFTGEWQNCEWLLADLKA